jgi:hypothetical protein
MEAEKVDGALDPPLIDTRTNRTQSPTKNTIKYVLSLGFAYILHSWLFSFTLHSDFLGPRSSTHPHTGTHDISWAIDAFAPKEPEVPHSQLAENFFL